MISNELRRRARVYIRARKAQQLDHTDSALDYARTEAHDAFMMQLDIEGIKYQDREHAAQIARAIVDGRRVEAMTEQEGMEFDMLRQQVEQPFGVVRSRK